jgi:hypothetical protein
VIRSEEVLERRCYRQGELTTQQTDQEWLWITTLPAQAFPASVIRRLGHDRWKNENNGWMDLTKHWAFKHGFLHACRHRPKRTNPSGERELVPNQGLAAVTLILLIAFGLCSAFVLRHSKLARRDQLTAIAVATQLLHLEGATLGPSSHLTRARLANLAVFPSARAPQFAVATPARLLLSRPAACLAICIGCTAPAPHFRAVSAPAADLLRQSSS